MRRRSSREPGLVSSRRRAPGPGPRHRDSRAEGPRPRRLDETWTSPSLPRAYPIVPVRGEGLTVEDIDGNLFLDFAAGIAVNSTGHGHPQVVAAIKEQAAELIHFSAVRLLPADLPRGLRAHRPDRADRRSGPGLPRQLRDRGRRGRDQAGAASRRSGRTSSPSSARSTAGPTARSRSPRRRPSTTPASGRSCRASSTRRSAGSRTCAGSTRSCSTSSPRPTRSRRSSSSRSRARAATSSPRTASSRACARSATGTGSCSSPTRSSRAPGGPATMWAVEHWGVKPDILLTAKGIASGMPLGALVAKASTPRGLGARRARLDLRRQPGRLCRGARDDRPARGRSRRRTPRIRGEQALAGLRRCSRRGDPGSSPTSAARA